MRAKLLALIITGFVFFAVSSAQHNSVIDNCCYVNRQCATNQEWEAGFYAFQRNECPAGQPAAPVSAPAGQPVDNCCYVNRQCATNQDWVDGWHAYQRNECPAGQPVAQAGQPVDNCCYVNRQCATNQDWVAGWHAFQRNECPANQPVAPASAPAGQPIDNCCFVNRLCNTDQEWAAGWHAFRNGHCFAPGRPQPVTPGQPVTSAPGSGGNCCSLGWDCWFEEERQQGYWVYQINQCAGLPQTSGVALTGPVPRIEGSGRFVQHVIATLKFMKSVAPAWYNYVITGMDVIVEVPVHLPPDYYDGQLWTCTALAYKGQRKASLETCWIDMDSRITGVIEHDQAGTAAALGHEACHLHLYEEGINFPSSEREEEECRKYGGGASVLLNSALATGLDPRRGTSYFPKDSALSLMRRYCSDKSAGFGFRPELFCTTLQRLEAIWRNVPYARFPPGAPD